MIVFDEDIPLSTAEDRGGMSEEYTLQALRQLEKRYMGTPMAFHAGVRALCAHRHELYRMGRC